MDKKALIKALRDTAQSASNTIARGVSAPVDLIAAGLRKMGVPVPENALGGSRWMEDVGLTIPVQEGIPKTVGETFGMIFPMAATAKAPQIAAGANRAIENAMAPATLNTPGFAGQRGAILFHGSRQKTPLTSIKNEGLFGGLFASGDKKAALSHGDALYRMTIPDNQIMKYDDAPWDVALKTVTDELRGHPMSDKIADMALYDTNIYSMSDNELAPILNALGISDLGEASWELQRLRGQIAKNAGFKAVSMSDEHGMSYLVLPGTKPRPFNNAAKATYQKKIK